MIFKTTEEYTLYRVEKLEAENEGLKDQVKEKNTVIAMKNAQYESVRQEQLRLLEEKETLIAILKDKIKNEGNFITFDMLFKHKNDDEINFIIEYFELDKGETEHE